jgi:hypothetical protein
MARRQKIKDKAARLAALPLRVISQGRLLIPGTRKYQVYLERLAGMLGEDEMPDRQPPPEEANEA